MIYPFIKDNSFQGINIDIKFTDTDINNPSYKVILSVNNINILDEKIITKDETFIIEPTNNKINCGNNLQCALQIQIQKMTESDKTYNLTVNVHSIKTSVPEIIETTEKSSKTYIPKDGYKLMQIPIGKNEETQFNLKFSSGEGKVLAILVNKNQNYDINTIFNGELSNFLNYDSKNKIIRITKEESKMCEGGCELLLKMSVENTNEDFVEISFEKNELTLEEKNEKDENNKIDSWLAAVITIVCVVGVSGALITVYFLILRKKSKINIIQPEESKKDMKISNNNDIQSKDGEKIIQFNK